MATVNLRAGSPDAEIRRQLEESRRVDIRRMLYLALVLGAVICALAASEVFDPARYRDALQTLRALAADSLPPDFDRWRTWTWPLVQTLSMSIGGTALGAAAALPLAVLVAGRGLLSWPARLCLNLLRSFPELIFAIILVAAVGFGPLPGTLALALHSTGMLGKFYSELMEHADPAPAEALRAQGSSRPQIFLFATLRQILPGMLDVTLYRCEHNLRAATVVGLVGAGGIGLELVTALRLFEYREALALLLLTLALVTALDWLGTLIRRRFI